MAHRVVEQVDMLVGKSNEMHLYMYMSFIYIILNIK